MGFHLAKEETRYTRDNKRKQVACNSHVRELKELVFISNCYYYASSVCNLNHQTSQIGAAQKRHALSIVVMTNKVSRKDHSRQWSKIYWWTMRASWENGQKTLFGDPRRGRELFCLHRYMKLYREPKYKAHVAWIKSHHNCSLSLASKSKG